MSQPLEGHTIHRYDGELNHLHTLVLEMGGLALDQVNAVLRTISEKNLALAHLVLKREPEVDQLELKIDNEITTIIARRSPVASDLRVTMSFSKTVTDLERIGDEAARMADIILKIYENDNSEPSHNMLRDIHTMGSLIHGMLQEALEVFDTLDIERAEKLAGYDGELNEEFQSALRRQTTFVLEDARNVGHAINIVLMTKALERIGEHAINLAEYVIYLVKGKDVRHQENLLKKTDRGNGSGDKKS